MSIGEILVKKLNQQGSIAGVLVAAIIVSIVGMVGIEMLRGQSPNPFADKAPTNFKECVAAGNPVQESYPEVCRTKDGRSFTNTEQESD